MRFGIDSEIEQIVDRMAQILFAAEIAFRRLYGCMAQQELNLFQLATAAVAELGTSPAQIMGCNMLQSRSLTACLYDVPDHVLRDAVAPNSSSSADRSEDPALRDASLCGPFIKRGFDPHWNRYGADMAALADQIHDRPVPLPHLNVAKLKSDQLRSAQAATKQHGQHGIVALGTGAGASRKPQNLRRLFDRQPVAGAKPELLHAFHAADSGSQFRAQQAGVRAS